MGLFNSIRLGSSAAGDYEIERSLRFNDDDTAYLNRTPSSTGNRQIWTFSVWIKPTHILAGTAKTFFSAGSNNPDTIIKFDSDRFEISRYYNVEGGYTSRVTSTRVLRDPSAWYHLVGAVDTTQSTASNRVKLYVNGTQVTDFDNSNYPAQNFNYELNSTSYPTYIGRHPGGQYFDGYIAEFNFVDGQQLTPSSFAETDNLTGEYKPKRYSGSYGTNGFYLNFLDNSGTTATTLGKDSSGNGNNFTPNNFSVASGKEGDSFADTPTNNFCTFNSLVNSNTTQSLSDGGLTRSGGAQKCVGTFVLENNKYYFEYKAEDSNGNHAVGVTQADADMRSRINTQTASCFASNGEFKIESGSQTSGFVSWGNGDIVQVAIDTTLGTPKVWFGVNNSWQGASGSSGSFDASGGYSLTAGKKYVFNVDHGSGSSSTNGTAFFGAHQGGFNYDPPTGFVAASQANLPDPSIKLPDKHFDTLLYTGTDTSANRTISGLEFSPDLVWQKRRNGTNWHTLMDTVRGAGKTVFANDGSAEASNNQYGYVSAFTSDGYTWSAGSTNNSDGNETNGTFVSWNWNAGGSTVTNNDGTISTQVRANTSAGFSIVTYTGDGNTNASIGHGLGVAPDVIILKNRSSSADWVVMHSSTEFYDGGNYKHKPLKLNTTDALVSILGLWATPNSSTQSISDGQLSGGNRPMTNTSGDNYVAYFFSSVAGYSKAGSYTGNGNADGTFVFLGFRPAWVMIKQTSSTAGWMMYDSERSPSNQINKYLQANYSNAEVDSTTDNPIDFLSNGMKMRYSNTATNQNGGTYIYLAFAESPFKYSRAR